MDKMVQRRDLFGIILVTSLGVWLMLLITLFLPTTGLLSRSPSGDLDQTLLNFFLLSGAVAAAACFVTGLEKLEVRSRVLGIGTAATPSLTEPSEPVQTEEIQPVQTEEIQPVQTEEIQPVQTEEIQPVQTEEIQPVQTEEIQPVQTEEMPQRDWTWRVEECSVKGKQRSVFRDIKSGRFAKDPVEPDGMRRLLGLATSIYPSGYTIRATGNPQSNCIIISNDKRGRRRARAQRRGDKKRGGGARAKARPKSRSA